MATAGSSTDMPAPSLPKMDGQLFTYYRDEYQNRVAFRSGDSKHKRHVVLLGGLGDGAFCFGLVEYVGQVACILKPPKPSTRP